jgi:GNAT superfamily N-acetyltransferase
VQPVRRATAGDLDRVIELHSRFCAADGHEFSESTARAALEPLLVDDRYGVVWISDGEEGEGYAVVTWGWSIESGGPDALVDEIYAAPTSSGIGTALMTTLLEDIERRGITSIFLETEARNDAARRFYRRFGFVEEDSRWMSRSV